MSFKLDDVVAVIDDAIRGRVTHIHQNEITIESDDGFSMKFNKSELVKIAVEQSELLNKVVVSNSLAIKIDTRKKVKTQKVKNKKDKVPPMEVDLHIDKLAKSKKGMDNFDIMTLQLDTAKYKLEFAIRNRIPRIVFIHGVGEGVLKEELMYLLRRYNVVSTDASYQKYGMGATEVYLPQNTKEI